MSTMEWIVLVWLAALGGCIGSFMNVVVYRLPAGKSLSHPGSRCPHCDHPIRWVHNVPVLGWLVLRGKCHDCGAPISARYPAVEALVAVLFVAIGLVLFQLSGSETQDRIFDRLLWGVYASCVTFVCTAICIALIQIDQARVPRILYLVLAVSGTCWAASLWRWGG